MENKKRVALVTGASVGIGETTALKLAEAGCDLVLFDINEEKMSDVKARCEAFGVRAGAYACDISCEAAVNEAVADAINTFGKIDILVNNAALWRGAESFLETSIEKWKLFIDINIMGMVYITRAVLPKMIENNYGKIINVASVAGVYGNADMACYSATKGAMISFTKALAKEVAQNGISVNSVAPGTVSACVDGDPYHTVPNDLSYMGRSGSVMENAELICFLASDKAPYITGQNIQIDGCRRMI